MNKAKQNFIQGATILAIAMIIVKIIGAVFKIPLANLLSGSGMGYFNTAYLIFTPIYSLAVAGLPTAVSKIVAREMAFKNFRQVKKTMKISFVLYLLLGFAGTGIMCVLAKPFVEAIKNPNAYMSILAISPALIFSCIMAAYRGYYEGQSNMKPTAISQVVEAFAKLIFGLSFSYITITSALNEYEQFGTVLGASVKTLAEAKFRILPIAAAMAILGITLSTVAGSIYLFFRYKNKGDSINQDELIESKRPQKAKTLVLALLKIAIPIAIGGLVVNLTSLIDLLTILNQISTNFINDTNKMLIAFGNNIPKGMSKSEIPNFIYGAYSGYAVAIFNLIPAITSVFGKSALPNVVEAWTKNDKIAIRQNVEKTISVATFISLPAGLVLFVFPHELLSFLFSKSVNEIAIAYQTLRIMGLGVIFLGMLTPLFSIIQAIGKDTLPVKLMLIGAIIKTITNFILIPIPQINIVGAGYGTLFCYAFIFLLSLKCIIKTTKIKLDFNKIFVVPLISSSFAVIGSRFLFDFFSDTMNFKLKLTFCLTICPILYIISLIILGFFKNIEIFKKIAKNF